MNIYNNFREGWWDDSVVGDLELQTYKTLRHAIIEADAEAAKRARAEEERLRHKRAVQGRPIR